MKYFCVARIENMSTHPMVQRSIYYITFYQTAGTLLLLIYGNLSARFNQHSPHR